MRILRSLSNRIFLATALMAILSIGLAILIVNVAVTRQAEEELARGLESAAAQVEQNRDLLVEQLALQARLIADLPKLKAAVEVNHAPTLAPIAEDYQRQTGTDLFVVTNATGDILARTGTQHAVGESVRTLSPIKSALAGHATISFWPGASGGSQVVTVPIWIDESRPELLGTLSVGFNIDKALAMSLKELIDSEVAFVVGGVVHASTMTPHDTVALSSIGRVPEGRAVRIHGEDYVALTRTLSMDGEWSTALDPSMAATAAPVALILRSRTARLAFLPSLQAALVGTGLLAVLVATLLSYAVAHTVTRPVAAIIAAMREMTATGDLTTRISLPDQGRWADDDTRTLAGTLNTMTDSITQFQRDAAQRERLSSLGRLSTVIAHEIRNPLMIIKVAVRNLARHKRQPSALTPSVTTIAQDINEEVDRLNHIVGEVLDFARPITFELGPVSLNTLCAAAVDAVCSEPRAGVIETRLDPAADQVVTDRERLRLTLVNVLTNASHAVEVDREDSAQPEAHAPAVELETHALAEARVAIVVRDRGKGIATDDLPRVFDPYFTTKRTGTGLGLAIVRNVVEGLGGTMTLSSRVGKGTEMRIELPRNLDAVS